MSFLGILLIAFLSIISLYSLITNSDIFSPAKFYIFSFVIFFGGALFGEYTYTTWFLVFLVAAIGAFMVFEEARIPQSLSQSNTLVSSAESAGNNSKVKFAVVLIWALSVPAIVAQLTLVLTFGGVEDFVNVLAFRVQEFSGYGYLLSIAATFSVINLFYFIYLNQTQRSFFQWSLFAAHTLFLIGLGGLSLSRGTLLNGLVLLLIAFHYQKRRIPMGVAFGIGVGMVLAAIVAGAARDGMKFEDGKLITGLDESSASEIISLRTSSGGIIALDILGRTELQDLQLGSTFVSVFTNVIPRDIWPEKPDTGGVVFTKIYAGDEWVGLSYLTPTLLGEYLINFGWVAGIILFLVCYSVLVRWVIIEYRKINVFEVKSERSLDYVFDLTFYIISMWMIVGLMAAEVTNSVTPFVVTKVMPFVVLKISFKYFNLIGASRMNISKKISLGH